MVFGDFVRTEWRPKAELALRKSTVKYYNSQLDKRLIPAFASRSLCNLDRMQVEGLLSNLKQNGHAIATIRGVPATLSTMLQAAVERG